MSTFPLRIITPAGEFYSGEVEYLGATTTDGRIGFMRGALPRVCVLVGGRIDIKTSVIEMSAVSGNGVINIASDGITVVTESCRFSNDGSDDVSEAVERKDDEHASMRDYKREIGRASCRERV